MAFYVATYGLNQLCQCHRPPTALALILRMSYDTSTQSFNSVDQIRPEPACLPYSDFAAADKYLFERARSEDHRCISCGGRIRHLSSAIVWKELRRCLHFDSPPRVLPRHLSITKDTDQTDQVNATSFLSLGQLLLAIAAGLGSSANEGNMAFEHHENDAFAGACGKRRSRDVLAGRDSWISVLDSASTLGTFAIDVLAASEVQPPKKTPQASDFPPPPPRPSVIPAHEACTKEATGAKTIPARPRKASARNNNVALPASEPERRQENGSRKELTAAHTGGRVTLEQTQRPALSPGLPSSYQNNGRTDPPLNAVLAVTMEESQLRPVRTDGLGPFNAPKAVEGTIKSRKSDVDQWRQPPRMVPSPALHIEMLKDVPWPRVTSPPFQTRPTTMAPAHSRTQSAQTTTTTSSHFSRGSSVTFPTTAPSSQESCINVDGVPDAKAQRGAAGSRRGFKTVSGSISDTSLTNKLSGAVHKGEKEQHDGSRHIRAQSGSQSIVVTVEQSYSYQILEPVSKCEAIMLPRPRLRSRSMAAKSGAVVTTIHAAPERVWHRDRRPGVGQAAMLTSRTAPIGTPGRVVHFSRSKSDAPPTSKPESDIRLQLHASMPPPVPPKDHLSTHASTKPLPPIPTPYPWKVTFSVGRERAESVELLEAVEILELNRQLDAERQAWRHQHSSSIGSHGSPFFDRLNPCLLDPTDAGVATTLTNRRVRRAKSDLRRPSEGSVKRGNGQQRRSKMPDTGFTFPKHNDGGPGPEAASTSQLIGLNAFGKERRIVVEEPIVIGRSSVPVHAEAARIADGARAKAHADLTTQASSVACGRAVEGHLAAKSQVCNADSQSGNDTHKKDLRRAEARDVWSNASQNINVTAQPALRTSSAIGALGSGHVEYSVSQEERDQLEAEDRATELDAPAASKTSCSKSECSCQMCRRSASKTARQAGQSDSATASWLNEPVQRLAPVDRTLSSSYEEIKGDATRECGPSEHKHKRSDTDNSNLSADAHGEFRIWEANTVDVDSLFFRPPPKRTPTD
ncbi:hypothetical protein L1887_53527 [Cichorium endivia]|nr:hypothetical protein L1887_53527 [Cichorium endivia]